MLSVSIYSGQELSQIAQNLYKEFADFIDTYEDRAVADYEARHEAKLFSDEPNKRRDQLDIRLDNYRWFFERLSLANQLESVYNYTKYADTAQIERTEIKVIGSPEPMTKTELYNK